MTTAKEETPSANSGSVSATSDKETNMTSIAETMPTRETIIPLNVRAPFEAGDATASVLTGAEIANITLESSPKPVAVTKDDGVEKAEISAFYTQDFYLTATCLEQQRAFIGIATDNDVFRLSAKQARRMAKTLVSMADVLDNK